MVLYFTSTATNPPTLVYMGRDKYENEDLIKYGWEEDFHVDKLSSAHVYVRLPEGFQWDQLPEELLTDCAQLVKANSIEGNKLNNVRIVYTPWSNLKKTGDMAVGQVSFHNPKLVRRVMVEKRANEIVNRLNKTKEEKYPDLADERRQRDKQKRQAQRALELEQEGRKAKEQQSYSSLFDYDSMSTNTSRQYTSVEEAEDDFM
ncbi:hypothetical protein SYNPS1DRAFT_19577 [Syncephalis pseudoplumigaleata]|uniref:FHA domain-containing protein n=1 Tax=Syncephalis pseudoplumigaleata TaxID=1712513 RepID=A0A4P9YSR0_9FUNG|nr:hypothetical protein SYNPS1DRAFT_19577 [Syncephalis pseudoplumigaleata]|eukprot:RKP22794.1 hypothetical protein SYNPS1DRAFT_19577 [Syncephalis pseudoplumigaleata]